MRLLLSEPWVILDLCNKKIFVMAISHLIKVSYVIILYKDHPSFNITRLIQII